MSRVIESDQWKQLAVSVGIVKQAKIDMGQAVETRDDSEYLTSLTNSVHNMEAAIYLIQQARDWARDRLFERERIAAAANDSIFDMLDKEYEEEMADEKASKGDA